MIHPKFCITDVSHQNYRSLILVRDVREWFESSIPNKVDVHKSIFRFSRDIYDYQKENIVNGKNSTRGYKGKSYADYLPIEIDGEGESSLEKFEDGISKGKEICSFIEEHDKQMRGLKK